MQKNRFKRRQTASPLINLQFFERFTCYARWSRAAAVTRATVAALPIAAGKPE
jgi:hypothetical protein